MEGMIMCEGVCIGSVPKDEDLKTLAEQGIQTLVDVREPGEAQTDELMAKAHGLGLRYLNIPISKKNVDIKQIDDFASAVADSVNAPVYAFSATGLRPVGALCFLTCTRAADSVLDVFRKAKRYGCPLEKAHGLKTFILEYYSSHRGDMLNNHFQRRHA